MLEITGITCPMCYPLALGAPARPSHPIRSQMEAGIRANVGTVFAVFVPRTCQQNHQLNITKLAKPQYIVNIHNKVMCTGHAFDSSMLKQ